MCISPNHVWVQRGPKWEKQPVACRQCWRCLKNRLNDYVARSLCEAWASEHVATVTLTYAPREDFADKILHPRHFQLFIKLLRRAGHKVRYLVAGEYGSDKGRSHFHVLLFFKKLVDVEGTPFYNWDHLADPSTSSRFNRRIPQKDMCHVREWPHGHIQVDWTVSPKSCRYVCKYLLKNEKDQRWFSLSKKPSLGAEWFAQRALLAKELGVLPYSFEYLPPGADKTKSYLMTGATRRDYLNAITVDKADRSRMSEWVGKTFDKYERIRVLEEFARIPLTEQFQLLSDGLRHRVEAEQITEKCNFIRDLAGYELELSEAGSMLCYSFKEYQSAKTEEQRLWLGRYAEYRAGRMTFPPDAIWWAQPLPVVQCSPRPAPDVSLSNKSQS